MQFELLCENADGHSRLGRITTDRGSVDTPAFMPVGTVGSVKGVAPRTLFDEVGTQILLGNTYHLFLRPGMETIEKAGGLHAFMTWPGPILTDSGGYQVFSLAKRRSIDEEGVTFQSHLDGSSHSFTPESVVDIQRSIGSDIMMVLDECPPGDASPAYARESSDRTIRWAKRALQHFSETDAVYGTSQSLFAIVQGATYEQIRRDAARTLVDLDFPGYAIGGLSVGEPNDVMYEMVEVAIDELPRDKPRYLMGVGTPENLLENISRGIDMFDCVMPTRNGRNGMVFTTDGIMNIRNAKWQTDFSPLDDGLECYYSQAFSRAYVRHLFLSNEILGLQIASIQNLFFYQWLMSEARRAILNDQFESWRVQIQPRISRRL